VAATLIVTLVGALGTVTYGQPYRPAERPAAHLPSAHVH
jgi:hypothetical protein